MIQRAVIRGIPVAAFLVATILGWLAVSLGGWWPAAAGPGGHGLSPVFTPEVQRWAAKIEVWAAANQLDPNLVGTVMQIESCGWPGAESSSGAQGLFQVMPFHFAPRENMRDPDTNAQRGLAYLALALARSGGNVNLALAGYNGGHGRIGQDRSLWPDETRRYVVWGAGIYSDAKLGLAASPRLAEWLAAGGASLCQRAAQSILAW
jgi:soluble lytic murein transglycosylase-like protein